ncbi:1-deoxypentalenic acid 11-beta-hydroxylase-like [Lineus longissimus]|uniref:1-deoxypentalenic acid 11-beta-hydroxylase-like n=1 Tax=Lineus longissimus TaxID=88925 RepID=UPI002B4C9C49
MTDTPTPRIVKLGQHEWMFPSEQLQQLPDSSHLLGNRDALLKELTERGYLFIRGLHDRDEVLRARLAVIKHIKDTGAGRLEDGTPWEDGVLAQRCGKGCIPFLEGVKEITHNENVLKVIEGQRAFQFFGTLFGTPVRTFDFKWLRAIYREAFTGAHVDNVYMCRGTDQLCTMWTPMGDVTTNMGTLAVCEGSHKLPEFKHFQETYGNFDAEKEGLSGTGWFTEDPQEICSRFGGQWKTSDFMAGDVLIFTMRTVHMSSTNTTDLLRISCDTRWQPAHLPIDVRYIGDTNIDKITFGLQYSGGDEDKHHVTMEEMKKSWGF